MKKSLLLLLGTLLVVSTLPYSAFANQVKTRILIVHGYGDSQVMDTPNSVNRIHTTAENSCRVGDQAKLLGSFIDFEKSFITPRPFGRQARVTHSGQ
ncbi:MAG: hypothetical protein KDI49_03010 [Gammaproteobacteria bacterium]|nr:hypothetical protein [Gammaproteobacteria bacterium]